MHETAPTNGREENYEIMLVLDRKKSNREAATQLLSL